MDQPGNLPFLRVGLVHPDKGSWRALLRYLRSSSTFYHPEVKFDAHNNEWAETAGMVGMVRRPDGNMMEMA